MGGRYSKQSIINNPNNHIVTGVHENGIRWVRSFKVSHPTRQQRIFLVTVPRFAYKAFYNDWTYVPYMKTSILTVCSDIDFPPFHQGFGRRFCLKMQKEEFKDYDAFYVGNLSDSVDSNISRREAYQRFKILRTPIFRMFGLSTHLRDKPEFHASYIKNKIQKLVGTQHLYHPGAEFGNSYVVFIAPSQTLTALTALEEIGFYVSEAIEHDVGEDAKLQRLHLVGRIGNGMLLTYVYGLLAIVFVALIRSVQQDVEEHREEYMKMKAELIAKADAGSGKV